jgi:nucleoside-diphosphate-sugar epimerase
VRLFLTGAHGFLGRAIVPALAAEGHELSAPTHAALDITWTARVAEAIAAARPDVVIHLAARCGAQPSVADPHEFFRVNTQGTVDVLEACRLGGVGRFLFTSSMTVFGAGDAPMSPEAPFAPRHPYAAAKAAAEQAVAIHARCYGLRAFILRPTLVVGEGYREPHAIGDFVETVRRGGAIELYGAGTHRRDFVHPEDVARAVVRAVAVLADAPAGSCQRVNLSNDEPITMNDLADLVIATCGRGDKRFVAPTAQTFSLFASNEAARQLLGPVPRQSNRRIIERLWRGGAHA